MISESEAPEVARQPVEAAAPAQLEPAGLRRRVLSLAWPVIGQNLLETLLGVVDTLLVAGLGVAAIAGIGGALQIMFFVLAALSALSVGSSILVAQSVGARAFERASGLARQSLLWSVILAVPLALVGVTMADVIISVFGMEPEVAQIATEYLQVTMGTVVVLVLLILGGGVLRGAGDSRTPLIVTAIANVLNVILAYGLIYGHFGLPALGAVGSAWATFMARSVALLLMLGVLWRGRNGVSISGRSGWWPDWSVARRVLGLGIPAAVEQVLVTTAFLVMTILVARLGTDTLAAQRISMTALSFSFLPGIGFSLAATALVGQSIGARRPREGSEMAKIATLWAVMWMGAIAVLFFVFATPIMRLFTTDPEVIRIGAAGLRVVALTQPFWGVGMVQSGGLRGTGDTRFPLVVGSTGVWCAVLLAWIGLTVFGGGLPIVWGAFLITSPITATLTWRRFRRRVRELEELSVVSRQSSELAIGD
ncbi:MAG TPA: MATE family efflux transporter [Roseiflexaceae bacterium]|nr:MATE family efflux transporter [Roseiflexaceae bacterium]